MSDATKEQKYSTITVRLPEDKTATYEVRTAIWLEPCGSVMGTCGRRGKGDLAELIAVLACGLAAMADATGESPEDCALAVAELAHMPVTKVPC